VIEKLTAKLGEEVTSPYESGSWSAKLMAVGVTVNELIRAASTSLAVKSGQRMKNKANKRIFFFMKQFPFGMEIYDRFSEITNKKNRFRFSRWPILFIYIF
jgi:hypothetical protein